MAAILHYLGCHAVDERSWHVLLLQEEEDDDEEGGIATAIFSLYTDQDVTKRARLHSMTPVFQLLVQCALAGGKVCMRALPPTKRSLSSHWHAVRTGG